MGLSPVSLDARISGSGIVSQTQAGQQKKPASVSFEETLQAQILQHNGVKFSAHAQKRLAERNVEITNDKSARLEVAVDRVQQKGADKSLVLMDDLALLVSARNRVVITALDSESAKDGVFTGIDSAVIA